MLSAIGLCLIGVFITKLISRSLQIALTDYLLLALGFAVAWIGVKFNISEFIFSEGGRQRINLLFFKIGLTLSGLLIILKIFVGETGSYMISLEEGGIVEWASFLFLLSSAYMLFWCSRIVRPLFLKTTYRAISVISFVVGMEEVSWGQILFGWQTPEKLSLINAQGEHECPLSKHHCTLRH